MKQSLLLYVAAALLAVSCQTPPAPTSTPLAGQPSAEPTVMATATRENAPAPVVDVTPQATLGQFRGRDECRSGPDFELLYALDAWEPQGKSFMHRTIPDCTLRLDAIAQQVAGPKLQARRDLGGYSWEVSHFPNAWLTSYWLEKGGGCYLFSVEYSQQSPAEAAKQCQQAADAVIDSFRLVSQ